MGAIAHIRTANRQFSREFRAHAPGKVLRLKFSERQSDALLRNETAILTRY